MRKTPKKVLSFVLALVMLLSTFAAGFTAFAYEDSVEYEYNYMDWSELTYEQQLKALMDYLDSFLAQLNFKMDLSVLGTLDATSINSLIGFIKDKKGTINTFKGMLGDLKSINLNAFDDLDHDDARGVSGDAQIIKSLIKFVYQNKTLILTFVDDPCGFDLGLIGNFVSLDFGSLLGINKGEGLYEVIRNLLYQATIRETLRLDTVRKTYVTNQYRPIFSVYNKLVLKGDAEWSDAIFSELKTKSGVKDSSTSSSAEAFLPYWRTTMQTMAATYNDVDGCSATYTAGSTYADDKITIDGTEYDVFEQYTYLHYDYYLMRNTSGDDSAWDSSKIASKWDATYYNGKNSQNDESIDESFGTYWKYWDTQAKAKLTTDKILETYPKFDDFVWAYAPTLIEGLINSITDPDGELTFAKIEAGTVKKILCTSEDSTEIDSLANIVYKAFVTVWDPFIVPLLNTIDVDNSGFEKIKEDSPTTYDLVMLFNLNWKTLGNGIEEYGDNFYANENGNGVLRNVNDVLGYIIKNFVKDKASFFEWKSTNGSSDPTVIRDTFVENFKNLIVYFIYKTNSSLLPEGVDTTSLDTAYASVKNGSFTVADLILPGAKVILKDYIPNLHQSDIDAANTATQLVYYGIKDLAAQYLPEQVYTEMTGATNDAMDATARTAIFEMASDLVAFFMSGQAPMFTEFTQDDATYNTYKHGSDYYDMDKSIRQSIFNVLNYAGNYYLYGSYEAANALGLSSKPSDTAFTKLDEIFSFFFTDEDIDKMNADEDGNGAKFFSSAEWLDLDSGKLWDMIFNVDISGAVDIILWAIQTKAVATSSMLETIYYALSTLLNGICQSAGPRSSNGYGSGATIPALLGSTFATLNSDGKPLYNLLNNTSIHNIISNLLDILYYRIEDLLPLIGVAVGSLMGLTAEQSVEAASATVSSAVNSGLTMQTGDNTVYFNLINNAKGINRTYYDKTQGKQVIDSLYKVKVKSVSINAVSSSDGVTDVTGTLAVNLNAGDIVDSASTLKCAISGAATGSGDAIATITVSYNIVDVDGTSDFFAEDKVVSASVGLIYDTSTYYTTMYVDTDAGSNKDESNFYEESGDLVRKNNRTSYFTEYTGKLDGKMTLAMPTYVFSDTKGTNLEKYLWYSYYNQFAGGNRSDADSLAAMETKLATNAAGETVPYSEDYDNYSVGETYVGPTLFEGYSDWVNYGNGDGKTLTNYTDDNGDQVIFSESESNDYIFTHEHTWVAAGSGLGEDGKQWNSDRASKTYHHLPEAGYYFEDYDKFGFTVYSDDSDLDGDESTLFYSVDPNQADVNGDGVYDSEDYVYYETNPKVDRYAGLDLNTVYPMAGTNGNKLIWYSLFTNKADLYQKLYKKSNDEKINPGKHNLNITVIRGSTYYTIGTTIYIEDDTEKANLEKLYTTVSNQNRQQADYDLTSSAAQTAWTNYNAELKKALSALSAVITKDNCEAQNRMYTLYQQTLQDAVDELDQYKASTPTSAIIESLQAQHKLTDRLDYVGYTYQRYEKAYNEAIAKLKQSDISSVEAVVAEESVAIQYNHLVSKDLVTAAKAATSTTRAINPTKTAIDAEIARSANLSESDFTEESWAVYADALAAAQAVSADANTNRLAIKDAREDLIKAEEALVAKEASYVFTVTNDGTVLKTVTAGIADDTTVAELVAQADALKPTKTGYDFNTWTINGKTVAEIGTSTTIAELVANGDTTTNDAGKIVIDLVASYTIHDYKLTYNYNDGGETADKVVTFNYGTGVATLETPARDYFTFAGWNTKADGSGTDVTAIAIDEAEDITLYAQWTAISYDGMEGSKIFVTVDYAATTFDGTSNSKALVVTGFEDTMSDYTFTVNGVLPDGFELSGNNLVIKDTGVTANAGSNKAVNLVATHKNGTTYNVTLYITVNKIDRPADTTWSAVSATYTGSAIATPTIAAPAEDAKVTYTVTKGGASATLLNVGEYTITAEVAATANYKAAQYTTTFNITAASLVKADITVTPVTVTYGTAVTAAQVKANITGVPAEINYTVKIDADKDSVTDAGKYTVTVSADEQGNYNGFSFVYDDAVVINALNVDSYVLADLASFKDTTVTFDGTAKSLTATSSKPDMYTIAVTGDAITNAGEQQFTATATAASTNYAVTVAARTATLTVSAATPAVVVTTEGGVGEALSATVVLTAIKDAAPAGSVTISVNGEVKSTTAVSDMTDNGDGTYTVVVSTGLVDSIADGTAYTVQANYVPAASDNYVEAASAVVNHKSDNKSMTEVTVEVSADTVVYGDTITVTATAKDGTDEIAGATYSFSYDKSKFNATQSGNVLTLTAKSSGTTDKISVTASATGYNNKSAETTVSLTKRTLNVTVTAKEKVYDGNANVALTYEIASGNIDDDEYKTELVVVNAVGTFISADVNFNAPVTVPDDGCYSSNSNYEIVLSAPVVSSITAKGITVDIYAEKTWDGTATLNDSDFTRVAYTGLVNTADADSISYIIDSKYATLAFASSDVQKENALAVDSELGLASAMTLTNADGVSSNVYKNYYVAAVNTYGTITKLNGTVTATATVANATYTGNDLSANVTTADEGATIKFYKAKAVVADPSTLSDDLFTLTSISEVGTYYARAFKADNVAANGDINATYTSNTVMFVIDKDFTPSITVTNTDDVAAKTITLNISSLIGVDGIGGDAMILVSVDGGAYTEVGKNATSYTVSGNGTYKFMAAAIDGGKTGSDYTYTTESPEYTFTLIDAMYATASVSTSYVSDTWANEATFTVTVDNGGKASNDTVTKTYYAIKDGVKADAAFATTADMTANLVVDANTNATYSFVVEIENGDGTREITTVGSWTVKVDRDDPVISGITGAKDVFDSTTVKIAANDALSGIASTQYILSTTAIAESDYATAAWETYPTNGVEADCGNSDSVTYYFYAKVTDAAGNVTYQAAEPFTVTKSYEITFVQPDGETVISSADYAANSDVNVPTPTVDDSQNFLGWYVNGDEAQAVALAKDATTVKATQDVVYIAKTEIKTFTVKFFDYDNNTVLKEEVVKYGENATAPADPTKPDDGDTQFTFAGWDTAFTNVKSDLNVYPTWTDTTTQYFDVVFHDYNGDVLKTLKIAENGKVDAAQFATATASYKTVEKVYTATGNWVIGEDGEEAFDTTTVITANVDVYPTYTSVAREYTVKFILEGKEVDSQSVAYGSAVPAYAGSAELVKAADAQYTYTFDKWVNAEGAQVTTVTGDVTLYASFTKADVLYTVKFNDRNGTELTTIENIKYNSTIAVPDYAEIGGSLISDAQYTHTFNGWKSGSVTLSASMRITSNMTFTADVTSTVNKYDVAVYDEDGTYIATANAAYGTTIADALSAATIAQPTKAGDVYYGEYNFSGWFVADETTHVATSVAVKSTDTIKGNMAIAAKFTPNEATKVVYTLTFVDAATSTELAKLNYYYGDAVDQSAIIAAVNASQFAKENEKKYAKFVKNLPATVTASDTFEVQLADASEAQQTVNYVIYLANTTAGANPSANKQGTAAGDSGLFANGTRPTLLGSTPTIAGYEFKGWSKTQDLASAAETIAFDLVSSTNKDDITVYAIYAPVQAYVEVYDVDGDQLAEYTKWYGAGSMNLPADYDLTDEFYQATGWKVNGTDALTDIVESDFGKTIKVYATQKDNGVTLNFHKGDTDAFATVRRAAGTSYDLMALVNGLATNPGFDTDHYKVDWATVGGTTDVVNIVTDEDGNYTTGSVGSTADLYCYYTPKAVKVQYFQADGTTQIGDDIFAQAGKDIITSAPVNDVVLGAGVDGMFKYWTDVTAAGTANKDNYKVTSWKVVAGDYGKGGLVGFADTTLVQYVINLKAVLGMPMSAIRVTDDTALTNEQIIESELSMRDAQLSFIYASTHNTIDLVEGTNNVEVELDGTTYQVDKSVATLVDTLRILLMLAKVGA